MLRYGLLLALLALGAGCSGLFLAEEQEQQREERLAEKWDDELDRLVFWVERGQPVMEAARTLQMITEDRGVLVQVELREGDDFSSAVNELGLPVHQRMPMYHRASVWVSSLAELRALAGRETVERLSSTQTEVEWRW